ncbi:MAG: hypothetical protein V1779_16120 [bacterium]
MSPKLKKDLLKKVNELPKIKKPGKVKVSIGNSKVPLKVTDTSQPIPAGDSKPVRIPSGNKIVIACPDGGNGFIKFFLDGEKSIDYPQIPGATPLYFFPSELGIFYNEPKPGTLGQTVVVTSEP